MLNDKSILITGGTGSFGREFVKHAIEHRPRRLAVYSRDELKQFEMAKEFSDAYPESPIRYFIGDIRDKERMKKAFKGVDIVIHAAALKQVPAAEYNPGEAVATNIYGTQNVLDVALSCRVKKVMFLSTDKAVEPCNLYGCTKAVAERLVINANLYSNPYPYSTIFSCVRYGNVIGSRGSVIPFFKRLAKEKQPLPITDVDMTRFWMTLPQAVEFVIKAICDMQGGEIFVPKLPAMNICYLAKAIAKDPEIFEIGIRPGEKLHEKLISLNEMNVEEEDDRFIVKPSYNIFTDDEKNIPPFNGSSKIEYLSSEARRLSVKELKDLIKKI
jgi:UDP-N-acetylglucosamine 4,6-dehydratase